MTKTLVFPVDVELSEKKLRYICDQLENGMTDGQKVAGVAESSLSELGDGGMVLSGNAMRQIRDLIENLEDEQDIVRAVEAGKGMLDGKLVIPWTPDPTYVPVLEDIAFKQGITVEKVGQDLMDHAAANNWLYDCAPSTVVVFFERDDYRAVCEAFDRERITGTDLAAFIKSMSDTPEEKLLAEEKP